MQTITRTPQEVVQRGIELYEQQIKAQVEDSNRGKFLVINTETGEYEMDVDDVLAAKRARTRFAGAPLFSMRVGHAAAYRIGSRKLASLTSEQSQKEPRYERRN